MKGLKTIIITLLALVAAIMPMRVDARRLNDVVLNRPYTDMRRWHLGFSVGIHLQDITFVHNGYVTEDGQTWFMDQPSYSPGFCVNGLLDFRLSNYFNLRFSPGMYFGDRNIKMLDTTNGIEASQHLKSTYVVLPIDIKYSAMRYRNSRPYLTAGVMPAFDVSKKNSDYLKLKPLDVYLTFGLGCDFYLPYFKFIPEIKFCIGLTDIIDQNRPDLVDDPTKIHITRSLSKATSKMFVLTFYFE